jgi:hypothetical protein
MSQGTFQLIVIAIIAITIAQILMPFFVININSKIGIAIDEQRQTNRELALIRAALEGQSSNPAQGKSGLSRLGNLPLSVPATQITPSKLSDPEALFDRNGRHMIEDALRTRYKLPASAVSAIMGYWVGMAKTAEGAKRAEARGEVALLLDGHNQAHGFQPVPAVEELRAQA